MAKGKDKTGQAVPPGAYRVQASIELHETRKAVDLLDYADTDIPRDAATALAKVVDEVLHHFGVELSRKDSAARAMVTIAQTVGVLPLEIDEGTPLHVNTDVVVEQVKRAFSVLEGAAEDDPVSVLLRELHELLRPFDGLDNVVANALPHRVQSLINALETARLAAGEQRVRDALVTIATHVRMVPPDATPGTPVTVDLDALVDKIRWQSETVADVLDALDAAPDHDEAIGIGDRVRKALEAEHLLNHNRVPHAVTDYEAIYGAKAVELINTFVAALTDRMGLDGDPDREEVLAEIERRERDRTDLNNRMFVLLQVLGLFDGFDDGGYEVTVDARRAIVERVREWKTRLDGLGEPVPDGMTSALEGLRKDADMSSAVTGDPLRPWESWNDMRDRVREHAKFVREATGVLRLAPSSDTAPVLDELHAVVTFTDDVAKLLGFSNEGDASYTDLFGELSRRLSAGPMVELERYRTFARNVAKGLGVDDSAVLLDLGAVVERATAQQRELRELRSMADGVATNLGLSPGAPLGLIKHRTAKFSAVELGADLAAHEEFVRTACADLGLTGVVELADLRAKVKDLLSYRDFADDVRRHIGAPSDAYLGDVMVTVSRLVAHSRECMAPRWQRSEGATVELLTDLESPPTDTIGNGNTDVVTSWLGQLDGQVRAQLSGLPHHLTFDQVVAALNRARDTVMAQAPTIAVTKVLEVPSVTVAPPPVSLSTTTKDHVARQVYGGLSLGFATFAASLRDMAADPAKRGNHDPATLRMIADQCDGMPLSVREKLSVTSHPDGFYDRVVALETDARIRARALLEALGRTVSDTPTASEFFRAIEQVHALRSYVDELTTMLDCQPHEVAGRVELLHSRRVAADEAVAALSRIRMVMNEAVDGAPVMTPQGIADRVAWFVERHGKPAMTAVLDESHVETLGVVLREQMEASVWAMNWADMVRVVLRWLDENGMIKFDSVHKIVRGVAAQAGDVGPELPDVFERDGRVES